MKLVRGPHGESGVMMGGMSLRNYFAGAALTGILGGTAMQRTAWSDTYIALAAVHDAYAFADAMLAEREKP
jgi:sugar phosphate permease